VGVGSRRYDMVFYAWDPRQHRGAAPDEGIHCDSSRFRPASPPRPL